MATLFATYFVASFHHRRHTPLALPLPAVTPDPLAPLEALKPMGRGNSPTESQLDNACQRTEVVIFFFCPALVLVPQNSLRRQGKCLPSHEAISHNCGVGRRWLSWCRWCRSKKESPRSRFQLTQQLEAHILYFIYY